MSTPIIPKIITFTLLADDDVGSPHDFSGDVIDAAIVPTPGDTQKVTTLDGVVHQDVGAESYAVVLNCVQDWDSARPGLAYYLFQHAKKSAAVVLNVHGTGPVSAGQPSMSGTCTLVPIAYGGTGNTFVETSVELPITGTPVLDSTP